MKKFATEILSLLPDQKRKYLHLLLTEGEAAARAYLENVDCEGGIFIYRSEKELEAFKRRLEKCCPDETDGVWIFLPDNGRG